MGHTRARADEPRPIVRYLSEYPNFPEVSGTSLPLLSTVLAGFAVTITVQMMIGNDLGASGSGRGAAALAGFLLATLVFLSSAVFAVNAQAHNYLPFLNLDHTTAERLGIDDVDNWIRQLERRWFAFHVAALATFYTGVLLLLAGIIMVVWIYAGVLMASALLIATVGNTLLVLGVGVKLAR